MAGPIRIAILANGRQARRETDSVAGALGKLGKVGKVGFGILAVGAAAFGKSAVDAERKFSTSMRLLQASTGASSAEIKKLNDEAIRLGADTSFSAGEAASAMLELGKSGLSTAKIMAAVPQVMNLAATEGLDLAQAAGIVTSSLAQFKLRASESSTVVNALAGASNASRSSVASLGESLKLVGSAGAGIGLSVNETAAALAALSDAGLDGSVAGTSLAAVFNRLVPQTDRARTAMSELGLNFVKSNGDFKNIVQIAGELQGALGKVRGEANRKAKISAIFGNDASTIAAVNALMNAGADGLRDYNKATQDNNAAQKLAQARMDGTEGALERLSGAVETAKLRVGQELAPAVTKGADAFGKRLVPAIETGIEGAKDLGRALAPAAKEISEALRNLSGEGDSAGRMFNDVFLPAVRDTAEVVGSLVNFVDELPGPVKDIGVQVGIAALVFPRLAAGVTAASTAITFNIARLQQLRAELTYTATRAQLTATALARVQAAAKAAAGIGGMVLLMQAAKETNQGLKDLYSVGGGALLGFAVGGPVGAAIGGAAGALMALKGSTDEAKNAMTPAIKAAGSYASTLDEISGASTRATRAEAARALQSQGAFKLANDLDISTETLVSATLGQADAVRTVEAALKSNNATTSTWVDAMGKVHTNTPIMTEDALKLSRILGVESAALAGTVDKTREISIASGEFRSKLVGLQATAKNKIIARIESQGWPKTQGELRALVRGLNLTPELKRVVFRLVGAEAAAANVAKVNRSLATTDKTKVSLKGWLTGLKTAISQGASISGRDRKVIQDKLEAIEKANPNLAPYVKSVRDAVKNAKTSASGSSTVGNQLKTGLLNGMAGTGPALSAIMTSAVRGAIADAKREADSHSPSRKTMRLGRDLGDGLVIGMNRTQPKARTAGQKLVDAVRAGVVKGSGGVDAALARITATVEKGITGKNQGAREQALLKRYASTYAALRRNAKAQDVNTARLERARDRLKDLTAQYNEYRKAISDSIRMTGDVTQLGKQEDGTVSITSLLNELRTKAANADRFSVLLKSLATQGLDRTAIQQMLDAGPEAALATAEAITFGGAAAIKEINELQKKLAVTGDSLGKSMGDRYYLAGVNAAKGVVAGLEAQAKNLDKAAVRLANSLVAAVKKALGIRSPSRVFAGIGDNVVKGLDLGIDDTYVQRTGAVAAASLRKGFGTPALQAYAEQRAGAAGPGGVVRIQLTAEQVSQLQRGATLQADLDYARSNGVRGVTF